MKFLFGFSNGCYWLIIRTAEELEFALKHMNMTNRAMDVYLEALTNNKVICLNEAGGYHPERFQNSDKTQLIEKDTSRFPTKMDRVEVLKKELLVEINELEEALGQPLTKKIILD